MSHQILPVPDARKHSQDNNGTCSVSEEQNDYLKGLCLLPRPQVVIDDVHFLAAFSLRSQKLTLRDILMESTAANNREALEEFPPVYSKISLDATTVDIADPRTPIAKIHLNKAVLSSKQMQLQALVELYDSETEWLSCGSRLWFGQLTDENVSLFIDFSDDVCFDDKYIQFSEALSSFFSEQILKCERRNVNFYGTEVVNINVSKIKSIEAMLNDVKPQGTCNLLNCLQVAFKTLCKTDTLFIIVCSRPDQDLELLFDYAVQLFKGQHAFKIHIAAINVEVDIQNFLRRLSRIFGGHYHQFTSNKPKNALEDTMMKKIQQEKRSAVQCISDVERIIGGEINESLIDDLRQLSLILEWSGDCASSFSLYSIPCSTEVWLKEYGLDSLDLNMYRFLAPDTFNQLSEYVPVIGTTALSTVYDVMMPKFTWKDGSQKYLHVDVHRLENYLGDLKIHSSLLQSRLVWLQSGSRVVFGNLAEDRVVVIIDSSLKSSLHVIEQKQHLKTLLHEQIFHKGSFNFISFAGNEVSQWQNEFCNPGKEAIANAWKWILGLEPSGNCNLLACLRHSINFCLTTTDENEDSPIGIYLILSSVPDQDIDCISGYLEQVLSGTNIGFHTVLYQPIFPDPDIETATLKGIGRHMEEVDLVAYAKSLSDINGTGTLHKFIYGEFQGSNDHSELIKEIATTNDYLKTVQQILDNYEIYCKRNVPISEEQEDAQQMMPKHSLIPMNPRPTLTSVARMNCNAVKLKELDESFVEPSISRRKRRNLFLTCQTFYTGQGLRKGRYHDLVDLNDLTIKKSLIPSKEAYLSSTEWLRRYGLESLGLVSKKMFTSTRTGFKHVTADGKVVQLSRNHQELCKLLLQVKQVKLRYFSRLQWLLSGSRLVFGCLLERKIILLVDNSASMSAHFLKLTEHLSDLIDEQLKFHHKKSYFNIITYAQKVNAWRPQLTHCTEGNRAEAQEWVESLTTGGSSCLLEGINVSLKMEPDAVYVVTDGETDHSHKFMLSQISRLKHLYPHCWKINTIAFHSRNSGQHKFLQQFAHNSSGRYHSYPCTTDCKSSSFSIDEMCCSELGDDLNLLVKEMQLADSTINKLLYYMGRAET